MIFSVSKKYKILFLIQSLFVATLLMSCDLDKDDSVNIPVVYVSLYQASPNAPNLDIEVDNRVINVSPFEYTDYTGYQRFYTGQRNFKFRPSSANNVVIDTTFNFENNNAYSIFVIDKYDAIKALLLKDNTDVPATGKAKVRFVNLSPDLQPVTLTATGIEGNSFSNIAFQHASDFTDVTASEYDFTIRSTGGQALLEMPDISLQPGWYYTILVRGYANPPLGSSSVLSAQVIVN